MKARKTLPLLLAVLALTACKYDDSALWEQLDQNKEYIAASERIAALDVWQAKTNTNIQSTRTLLGLSDCITAVTPVTEAGEEVGYTITFLNSPAITIYHGDNGTAGATPQIGVTQEEDGKWYWTLNGDLLTDGEGNSIQANGDSAPVPQLSTGASLTVSQDSEGAAIVADAIYLSVDDGETWTRVSGEDGKSFFSDVDTSDPTRVTFTLSDGTSFSIARYTGLKLNFDKSDVYLGYGSTITVDFTAEGSDQFTADNLFIIAPVGWKASADLTTTRASTGFSLTVTAPEEAQLTAGTAVAEGDILVMLSDGQSETIIGRIKADCKDTYLVMNEVSEGDLATAIGDRTDLISITVTSGTLNEADWGTVRQNQDELLYLDLEGVDYNDPDKNDLYYSYDLVDKPLIDLKLPGGVTGIGDGAFNYCTALTSVTLQEGLTCIEARAFNDCSALESITLPKGLTSLGESSFEDCSALTSIILPEGLQSIGESAFYGCSALTSVILPEGLQSIGERAFDSCSALTSIILPEGLQSIGYFTFQNCTSITSVTLPASLKSIGLRAFANCSSLTSIILPEELTTIEAEAFRGCSSLSTITLPAKMKKIEGVAFSNCTALTTVTCLSTTPPELLNNAFGGCSTLAAIYVPAGSVEAYQAAAGWSEHADIIQTIP